ncbi:MAG TPA: hypothetical protein VFG69_01660 [Nannocystaceae bacterium]|nr:hypothetical protein [Nannocystaceae bacterium]
MTPTHALVSDITPNRCTIVCVGSEDDCREAATDDRQQVLPLDPEIAVPEEGTRGWISRETGMVWGK